MNEPCEDLVQYCDCEEKQPVFYTFWVKNIGPISMNVSEVTATFSTWEKKPGHPRNIDITSNFTDSPFAPGETRLSDRIPRMIDCQPRGINYTAVGKVTGHGNPFSHQNCMAESDLVWFILPEKND